MGGNKAAQGRKREAGVERLRWERASVPAAGDELRRWADTGVAGVTPESLWSAVRKDLAGDDGSSALHDICDANMVMDAALRTVYGREPVIGADTRDSARWTHRFNAAWDLARKDWYGFPTDRQADAVVFPSGISCPRCRDETGRLRTVNAGTKGSVYCSECGFRGSR